MVKPGTFLASVSTKHTSRVIHEQGCAPRCEPDGFNHQNLLERLPGLAGAPTDEYTITWPRRAAPVAQELISSIVAILDNAATEWTDGGFHDLLIETVVQQLVDEIVGQQYVIFHHTETTSRDNNHWGIR